MAYMITLDTETAGNFADMEAYVLGVAVVDLDTRKIVETLDFVVEEVFFNDTKMNNAYYGKKLKRYYYQEIKNGTRTAAQFRQVRAAVLALLREYEVKEIWAYNVSFDKRALEMTSQKLLGCSFIPETMEVDWKCSLKLFRHTIGATEAYKATAERTQTGRVSNNAQSAFKFVSGNPDFVEAHTGLRDVIIETEIFYACIDYLLSGE